MTETPDPAAPEQLPTPPDDFGLEVDPLGATTNGLPYPESTGPLNQGANDIKALALALNARGLDLRFDSRTVPVTPNAAGGFAFSFSAPFASLPLAVLMNSTSGRSGFCPVMTVQAGGLSVSGISGIAANAFGNAAVTETVYVSYLAIGVK